MLKHTEEIRAEISDQELILHQNHLAIKKKPSPELTLHRNIHALPMLSINKPIYECTAAYGHFGRKPGSKGTFSWEKTDKSTIFKK